MSSFDVSILVQLIDRASAPARALAANLKAVQAQTAAMTKTASTAAVASRRFGDAMKAGIVAGAPFMRRAQTEIRAGFTQIGAASVLAGKQVLSSMKWIAGLGAMAGLSAGGLFAMSGAWAKNTAAQSLFAKQAGVSLQSLRELEYVAAQSGVSIGDSLATLSQRLGEMRMKRGPLYALLKDTNNRKLAAMLAKADVEEALEIMLDVISKQGPEVGAALAQAAFGSKDIARLAGNGKSIVAMQRELMDAGFDVGRTGADGIWGKGTEQAARAYHKATGKLIQGAEAGAAGLRKAREKARADIGILTEEDAARAEAAAQASLRIGAALGGLRDSILSKIASPDLSNNLADLIAQHREAIASGVLSFYQKFAEIVSSIDWKAVGDGLMSIGQGVDFVAKAIGGWDKFLMGLAALRFSKPIIMAATGLMHIFKGLGFGLAGLGVGAATFIGKFGRVAGVVGLVASAALLLYRHWDKIAPAWQRVVEAGKEVIEALRPIAEACDAISVSLTGMTLNQLWDGFDLAVADQITSKLQALADALDTVAKAIKVIREAPGLLGNLLTPGGGAAQLGAEIGKEKKSGAPSVPIVPRAFPTLPPLIQPPVPPFGSPQPQAPGFGFKSEPQRSPSSGYTTLPKGAQAGTDLLDMLKSKIDELIGADALATLAANAPVQGKAPAGFEIRAEGPKVVVNQAPPSIVNNVTVNVASPDAAPAATAEAVARAIETKARAGMYDGVH